MSTSEEILDDIRDLVSLFHKEVQDLKKLEKLSALPGQITSAYEPLQKLLHDIDIKTKSVSMYNEKFSPVSLNNVIITCAICFIVAAGVVCGAFWYGGYAKQKTSDALLQVSKNDLEKNLDEATKWAASDEGKSAYRLARLGELQRFIKCKGDGWKIENGICFPFANAKNEVHGWQVPK
ncbi:MAG: hypothetical protein HQK81_14890 [Desulfovibrionaceae bacterium]|nr:hypothetical protein [Desulfovibrionaceae bacterium]